MVMMSDMHNRHNVTVARSGRMKRQVTSSFDGETVIAVDAVSDGMGANLLLEELHNGPAPSLFTKVLKRELMAGNFEPVRPKVPMDVLSDGQATVRTAHGTGEVGCKRRAGDVASLRQGLELGEIASLRHMPGPVNPTDPLTKAMSLDSPSSSLKVLLSLLYEGYWEIPK